MSDKFYGDPLERFRAMASDTNTAETIDGAHFKMWCSIAAEELEALRGKSDGWRKLNAKKLPPSERGPFLCTNNPNARNAHGRMSHVFLTTMFHIDDDGSVMAFDDTMRKLWGLTHFKPIEPFAA